MAVLNLLPGRLVSRGRLVYRGSRLVSHRSSMAISSCRLRGVDRGALIGDLSNKAIDMVSCVGGGLDTAVREGDGEGASYSSISVLGLSLLEVGLGVVISHSILIGIRLRGQLLNRGIRGRGAIGWGASS